MNNTKVYTPTHPVPDSVAIVICWLLHSAGEHGGKKEKLNTSFIFVDLAYDLTGKYNN